MEARKCCVNSCRQLSDEQLGGRVPKRLALYCFPCWRKNEGDYISTLTMRRRAAWVAAVGQGDITFSHIPTSMRVCSRHFHSVPVRAALCPWREARSLLQSVLKPEEDVRRRPADQTPEETELPAKEAGFRDFFRESLRAALKGASRTLPDQQTSRVRPETSRVRPETSRVRPETSRVRPETSSPESCVSCERLQRSVMVLQEELSRHTGLQVGVQEEAPDWAEPLEGDDDAEVESSSGSSKVSAQLRRAPRFQKSWLHKFWFLRYSAAQNLMWCYVCRLHTDRNHPSRGMVQGTSILKLHNIKQHTASLNHRNNVQRHMELGLSDTAPRH